MIYLPFKNLKNFTERRQKKFKKIIAPNGWRVYFSCGKTQNQVSD